MTDDKLYTSLSANTIMAKVTNHFLRTKLITSPTFSVRPRSSVGRVTEDLIRRSWVRFPPRSKDFFFTSCGSLIPFTRANAQWVTSWVQVSTLNYTSELILCSTICVDSATRHNIHMYPYFLFAAIHHLNRP